MYMKPTFNYIITCEVVAKKSTVDSLYCILAYGMQLLYSALDFYRDIYVIMFKCDGKIEESNQ